MLHAMIRLVAGSMFVLAVPALAAPGAAAPPMHPNTGAGYSAPGTYKLIPLPGSKVPAAWVLNTETGQTWLCGAGTSGGQAHLTCLPASIPAKTRSQ